MGGATGIDNTDEALAAFGLVRDGPLPQPVDTPIYPCNDKTVRLFIAMGTQWRIGMNGATGLDYTALPLVAKAQRIKLSRARFHALRVMESATLAALRERSDGRK